MEQPSIMFEGKKYWQIGCKNCQRAELITIFFEPKTCSFAFKCECGHVIKMESSNVKKKPNETPINLRQMI